MKTIIPLSVLVYLLFQQPNLCLSQTTWKKTGISVTKSGSSLTVKWTNENDGVTTKSAQCEPWKDFIIIEGYSSSYYTTCTCSNGNWFRIEKATVGLFEELQIKYYNSLDSFIWEVKGLEKY